MFGSGIISEIWKESNTGRNVISSTVTSRLQSIFCFCRRARAVAIRTSDLSANDLEAFMLFFCGKSSQSEIITVRTIHVSTQRHVLIKSSSIECLFPTNNTQVDINFHSSYLTNTKQCLHKVQSKRSNIKYKLC